MLLNEKRRNNCAFFVHIEADILWKTGKELRGYGMNSFDGVVNTLVWGGRLLKLIRCEKLVRAVRLRVSRTLFQRLHTEVIHQMRDFALCINSWTPQSSSNNIGYVSRDTATACRNLMSDILEIPDQELHCCIKAIAGDEPYRDRVLTWARSKPQDTHGDDKTLEGNHLISNNSVYASLMGIYDGKTRWSRPFSCFSCSDLTLIGPKFICSRENWEDHYHSTIVFPLRYVVDSPQRKFYTIGFLCFYSKRKDVFVGMPNIFDYIDRHDEYVTELENSCVFQIGASMTDILSTFLRSTYEQGKLSKRKQNSDTRCDHNG